MLKFRYDTQLLIEGENPDEDTIPQRLPISFAKNEPFEQKTDIKTALPICNYCNAF